MAEINFGLLDTQLPGRIATIPLQAQEAGQANALRAMQMMQGQQQLQQGATQAEMTRVQLAKIKRDEEALTGLTRAISGQGGPMDLNEAADAMIKTNIPHFVDMGITIKQKQTKLLQDYAAMGLTPPGAASAAPAAMPGAPAPQTNALAPTAPPAQPNQLDPAAQRARVMMMSDNPGVRDAGKIELERLGRAPVLHNVPGVGLVDPSGKVITASVESTDPEIKRYEYAKTQGYKGSLLDFKSAVATAGRAQATPSAPVSVVGPDGKITYVSREEAIRNRMTPAAAMESLPPKEIQKREASYPQATSGVKSYEAKSEAFISDLKKLRDHPGLPGITGILAGRVMGITDDGRAAKALYDKIVAKGGFQALQDLRDMSKTGGALGNVSDKEGKQLIASFAAIDRTQEVEDVQRAIDQAVGEVEGSRTRVREAYDTTYEYKAKKDGAAPAAVAPIDQQALDWANAHPADPRARAIKQRLGR
jgi:hypothetical protein